MKQYEYKRFSIEYPLDAEETLSVLTNGLNKEGLEGWKVIKLESGVFGNNGYMSGWMIRER